MLSIKCANLQSKIRALLYKTKQKVHSCFFRSRIKVKLIMPRRKNAKEWLQKYDLPFSSVMFGETRSGSVMYAIPLIAALCPEDVEVTVQDEDFEEINYDDPVDIVAITTNVALAPRAYEIADVFRLRGVKVVLGGIHSSFFQEEALSHADAIVIGEAEQIWSRVIEDFRQNNLQQKYEAIEPADVNLQPLPRYDLLPVHNYAYYTIQTIVGCSSRCDYCAIHTYPKGEFKYKSVLRVIQEVKHVSAQGKKLIYFCDSNFAINFKRAKELAKVLQKEKIIYVTQARLEIFRDDELLELLHDSGCANIVIGFETINPKNLETMNKRYNVDLYCEAIEKIQRKGLLVTGSFMFGFDNDDITVFEKTAEFINQSGLGAAFMNIVTPLPGTPLYSRLEKERRILHHDWTQYDFHHVCFQPKQMSANELKNGYFWVSKEVFSLAHIYKRVMSLYEVWNKNNVRPFARTFPLMLNLNSHYAMRGYANAVHPREYANNNGKGEC